MACSRRSMSRARFGKSVRGSCSAWWASCSSIRLRSVISVTIPSAPAYSPPSSSKGLVETIAHNSDPSLRRKRKSWSSSMPCSRRSR